MASDTAGRRLQRLGGHLRPTPTAAGSRGGIWEAIEQVRASSPYLGLDPADVPPSVGSRSIDI